MKISFPNMNDCNYTNKLWKLNFANMSKIKSTNIERSSIRFALALCTSIPQRSIRNFFNTKKKAT